MSQAPLKTYQVVLVLLVAAIGFLFDTYELLMFPVIGNDALDELLKTSIENPQERLTAVRLWAGRMLWIAALCGGVFGLLGGWLIDRLGRKTVMAGSIMVYSFSPVCASFSTELWMLVLFRCTTFIGVCVELVAAVTWLAELFEVKRTRELAIAWTLACASLGGILVTEVYNAILTLAKDLPVLPVPERFDNHAAWRYTLLTGLVPGALILLLLPFVPESRVWREKKSAGTLRRPSFGALFSSGLKRTTIVTTILSACGYAAAFGALQLTPLQMVPGMPDIAEQGKPVGKKLKDAQDNVKATAGTPENAAAKKALGVAVQENKDFQDVVKARRGNIQRWQELGGLTGRILLAILIGFLSPRMLLRVFLLPGIVLFPVAYLVLYKQEYMVFAMAIFFCGLLTVAQFSYLSEFLPKVFPLEVRGTGSSFATNVGGRMLGTMAATFNTELLASVFLNNPEPKPFEVAAAVATGAAIIGGSAYFVAFVASFFLPAPKVEH